MMNKKWWIIGLGLLAVVLVGMLWKFFQPEDRTWEAEFNIEEIANVQKVVLEDQLGTVATLTRTEDGWLVNGLYPARKTLVNTMLTTVKNMQVNYMVSDAAHNNVITDMMLRSVTAEFFDEDGEVLQSFIVGSSPSAGEGSYMLRLKDGELAERAYLMYYPNHDGRLEDLFRPQELNWRSRVLYDYSPGMVKKVTVNYPSEPESSFELEVNGEDFAVRSNHQVKSPENLNRNSVLAYLDWARKASVEGFENEYAGKDSIIAKGAFCKVVVEDINGKRNTIDIFRMPLTERSKLQYDIYGNPLEYDLDRFFVLTNDGKDFGIAQYYVLGKYLKSYDWFFTET